jgi:hypothetical protein
MLQVNSVRTSEQVVREQKSHRVCRSVQSGEETEMLQVNRMWNKKWTRLLEMEQSLEIIKYTEWIVVSRRCYQWKCENKWTSDQEVNKSTN